MGTDKAPFCIQNDHIGYSCRMLGFLNFVLQFLHNTCIPSQFFHDDFPILNQVWYELKIKDETLSYFVSLDMCLRSLNVGNNVWIIKRIFSLNMLFQ